MLSFLFLFVLGETRLPGRASSPSGFVRQGRDYREHVSDIEREVFFVGFPFYVFAYLYSYVYFYLYSYL